MIRRLLSRLNFQLRKPRCRKAAKIGDVRYPIRGRQAFRFSTAIYRFLISDRILASHGQGSVFFSEITAIHSNTQTL